MHYVIKEILDSSCTTNQQKAEEINKIKESINIAERIFSGEFAYCKSCGDYFLSKSFVEETEIVDERVCVYSDPINSSGDEYKTKAVGYTYKYCPKGCKHVVARKELWSNA
jgi:hypothetical protein